MKKLITSIALAFVINAVNAQAIKKGTVKLDSTQVEKIHKMPMDTMHENMPVAPLTPKDSILKPKMGDDEDPKKSGPPK